MMLMAQVAGGGGEEGKAKNKYTNKQNPTVPERW